MSNISIILRKAKTFIKIDSKTKFDFLYAYFYTGIFRMYILLKNAPDGVRFCVR